MYKGWDVHSYTSDFFAQLREYAFFNDTTNAFVSHLTRIIAAHLHQRHLYTAPVNVALKKIVQRHQVRQHGYRDVQLQNINITLLLNALHKLVIRIDDASTWKLFAEALSDTNGTCTQGDSHRLAATYLGLKRSWTSPSSSPQ